MSYRSTQIYEVMKAMKLTNDQKATNCETYEHIHEVQKNLSHIIDILRYRGIFHDASKLTSPEVEGFTLITSKLKDLEYGSDEYRQCLKDMKPTIEHHYKNNRHHPEYFKNGINDMTLWDLIEMICDWRAAVFRTKGGDLMNKSLPINIERFEIDEQLARIITNSLNALNVMDPY